MPKITDSKYFFCNASKHPVSTLQQKNRMINRKRMCMDVPFKQLVDLRTRTTLQAFSLHASKFGFLVGVLGEEIADVGDAGEDGEEHFLGLRQTLLLLDAHFRWL